MSRKIYVEGDAGVALNAEKGASIHIHVNTTEKTPAKDPIKQAVHILLKTCHKESHRKSLENISRKLFNTSLFKDLTLQQLEVLQIIANEMNCQENQNKHSLFVQEIEEYEDFFQKTGIRAAKPEREALGLLLMQSPFHRHQVKKVWENGFLKFEHEQLLIKLSAWDSWNAVIAMSSIIVYLAILLTSMYTNQLPPTILVQHLVLFAVFVSLAMICIFHILTPIHIARRMQKFFKENQSYPPGSGSVACQSRTLS